MSARDYPQASFVRQCLREDGGRLFWLRRPRAHFFTERAWNIWNARFSEKEAGYCNKRKDGHRWLVCIDHRMFLRYQIVWLLHKGEWAGALDHKDRNPLNDRIENLRPANQSQNAANAKLFINNSSGFRGVRWREKTGKWQAIIRVN